MIIAGTIHLFFIIFHILFLTKKMHARLKSKFYLQFYRRHRLFSHLLSGTVPKIIIRRIYQTFSCSDFFFHRIFVYSLFQIRTYGATQPIGKNRRGTSRRIFDFQGYIIRDINWRSGKMELDIVAYRDKTLVVVEVKTRKNNEFLRPEEAVTLRKIKNIIQATDAYIRMFDIPFDIRFDIITLVGENEDFQIEHIEDAFLPPLNCR